MQLRSHALPAVEDRIEEIAGDADLDDDFETHFERVGSALAAIEAIAEDEQTDQLIYLARQRILKEIKKLEERKEARDLERQAEDEDDWDQVTTVASETSSSSSTGVESHPRSIFDDIDQH